MTNDDELDISVESSVGQFEEPSPVDFEYDESGAIDVDFQFKEPDFSATIGDEMLEPEEQVFEPAFDEKALTKQLAKEAKAMYENAKDPLLIKRATGPVMHIGIDSEYFEGVAEIEGEEIPVNNVLSIQAYTRVAQAVCKMIHYPKSYDYQDRPTFKKFISEFVNKALKEGVIDELPSMIYVYGHFLRADLPSFKDFFKFPDEVSGIGGTFASVMKTGSVDVENEQRKKFKPEPICLTDKHRHTFKCYVRYVDTLLHTPGRGGLSVVGDIIGLPKLELPEGRSFGEMDKFLAEDKPAFEAYAMRDAEISCEYGLYLHDFNRNELGLEGLPPTSGSCAVAAFKISLKKLIAENPELGSFEEMFGVNYSKEEYWHNDKQRNQTRTKKEVASRRNDHKGFIELCYNGARNEGYYVGPTDTDKAIVDLDLRGAYTIGLCDLFTFDYENIITSYDVNDYLGHVAGFLHVEFEFPSNTQYPCLPVTAGDKGLIFPLSGESYCTAPEILCAHNLGCKIKIIHGVIVPWKQTKHRIFEPIVNKVRLERNKAQNAGDKSKDAIWKNLSLQIYGKTAQGVNGDKKAFNTATNSSKTIGASAITHEMIAAHVTGFVRAVISELLNQIPENETVVSVTTDGFLGTYPLDKFNLKAPLSKRYQGLCDGIDGECMLEEKGRITQAIGMKTRGAVTSQIFFGKPPIMAKAGVKPIVTIEHGDTKADIKDKENEEMINLYLNRHFDNAPIKFTSLISLKEQWLLQRDLVRKNMKRRINLEFDFKRNPKAGTLKMVPVRDTEHLAFKTKPWATIEDFKKARAAFDAWRRSGNLKTMDDWHRWQDHYQCKLVVTKGCGLNLNAKGSVDVLRRVFIRAINRDAWGLVKEQTNNEIADWLTAQGFITKSDELKNATKAKLMPNIIPLTKAVIALLKVILVKYPKFDLSMLFREQDLATAKLQLV